jgi:hypothetical protein
MTQIASNPRSHQLYGSAHGPAFTSQPVDPFALGLPMLQDVAAEPLAATGQAVPDSGDSGDSDVLAAVWRASSHLESTQWELDAAQGALMQALRQAAGAGVGQDQLCKAANLTTEELAEVLEELPPAFPAAL